MRAARIFLTGGTGFLGRRAVSALLARGADLRCLVRHQDAAARLIESAGPVAAAQGRSLELVVGTLRDEPIDAAWLDGCDRVVHAAGLLHGAPSVLVRQNVAATRALTHAALEARVHRFVLVSSLSVYATERLAPGSVLDEQCPLETMPERRGAYVYSKVAQEEVCREGLHAGMRLVIVRPGVIFGPGRSGLGDRLGPRLGRFLALVDRDRLLPYTFVANCASAVAAAALTPGIDAEAFNIIDDELPTARQVVEAFRRDGGDLRTLGVAGWVVRALSRLCELCETHAPLPLPPTLLPYGVDALYKRLRFSNARARTRLGWRPHVGLHAALQAISSDVSDEQAPGCGRMHDPVGLPRFTASRPVGVADHGEMRTPTGSITIG